MVDISGWIDRIIRDYIEKGQYFTINRAHQYGKTTTLYLLERRLREEYIVLRLSFEAADEYFESMGSLAEGFGDVSSAWTKEEILVAIKVLLKEPNTLFDDMTKKLLDYPQLQEMLQNILFGGIDFPFKRETPMVDLGVTFGFLKDKNGIVAVSNRIFETQLYEVFSAERAINNKIFEVAG